MKSKTKSKLTWFFCMRKLVKGSSTCILPMFRNEINKFFVLSGFK